MSKESVREQIAEIIRYADTSENPILIPKSLKEDYLKAADQILKIKGILVEAKDQSLPEIPAFQYDKPEDIPLLQRGAINYSKTLYRFRRVEL